VQRAFVRARGRRRRQSTTTTRGDAIGKSASIASIASTVTRGIHRIHSDFFASGGFGSIA